MLAYLKSVFSSESCASFSRYATAVTILTGCGCLIAIVCRTHALPEAASLVALGAWSTAPYAINKASEAFNRPSSNPDRPDRGGNLGPIAAGASSRLDLRSALIAAVFVLAFFMLFVLPMVLLSDHGRVVLR